MMSGVNGNLNNSNNQGNFGGLPNFGDTSISIKGNTPWGKFGSENQPTPPTFQAPSVGNAPINDYLANTKGTYSGNTDKHDSGPLITSTDPQYDANRWKNLR